MVTSALFSLLLHQALPPAQAPTDKVSEQEFREYLAQQLRERYARGEGFSRAANGVRVRTDRSYIPLGLPEVPRHYGWLEAAGLAGVIAEEPEVRAALDSRWLQHRDETYARRDRNYDWSAAIVGETGRHLQIEFPAAARQLLARTLTDLPKELRADAESLKQALYVAHALRPNDPPLDDSRVESTVALASRRQIRKVLLSTSPVRFPPAFLTDLEDDPQLWQALWSGDEPLRAHLAQYERRAMSDLLQAAEAIRDYRRERAERAGDDRPSTARVIAALVRLWETESWAAEGLPVKNPQLLLRLQQDFRTRVHEASAELYVIKLRLRTIAAPTDPNAAERLAQLRAAVDAADEAMAKAWRERWQRFWLTSRPFDDADVTVYRERMRMARRSLELVFREALASDRRAAPGTSLRMPDGHDLAWVLQPLGQSDAGGEWHLREVGDDWPGNLPGPAQASARL